MNQEINDTAALPLFYREPVLLRFAEHGDAALAQVNGFGFAREALAIPLCIGEFSAAARNYPVVFAPDGDSCVPLAIVGLRRGENLFVEADGAWRTDCYVPAYVRRYPFIVMEVPGDDPQRLLAIDRCSEFFVSAGGVAQATQPLRPLFTAEGAAAPAAQQAMAFCRAYDLDAKATTLFGKALVDAGLLASQQAQIQWASSDVSPHVLNGFMAVEEVPWRSLSTGVLADWHACGWLEPVVLHLASRQNWQTLMRLEEQRAREKGLLS